MRRTRHGRLRPGYAGLAALALAAALWQGLIPLRYIPYATLDLAEPNSWFVDFRLAALKSDALQCKAVLTPPWISATAIPDAPYENGCGWRNAVRFSSAGGAHVAVDKMTCDLAAAYTLWMAHTVQPAAAQYFQSSVASVRHMGVYACRNIQGNKALAGFRSQHARANAIDVESFTLASGHSVSVAQFWKSDGAEGKFPHAIHDGACRYFRAALGPDYNSAHANHFHLDRGAFKSCK